MTAPLLPRDLGDGLALHAATTRYAEGSFAVVDAERERLREWLPWVDLTTSAADTRQFYETAERQDALGEGLHAVLLIDGRLVGHADHRIVPLISSGEVAY